MFRKIALANGDKMTARIMAMTAVAGAIVALALSLPVTDKGSSYKEQTYRLAQYCAPQLDELPGTTRVYC
jgi:hypothetical protein